MWRVVPLIATSRSHPDVAFGDDRGDLFRKCFDGPLVGTGPEVRPQLAVPKLPAASFGEPRQVSLANRSRTVACRSGSDGTLKVKREAVCRYVRVEGRAGQYPPFDTAWDALNGLVKMKPFPNQNHHAYGWLDSCGKQNRPETEDVSDFGMLHYVCVGEEEPTSQKLFA